MKKLMYSFFIFIAAKLSVYSQLCNNIPAGSVYAFTVNGKNYEIIKENMQWADAAACAVARGGKLAEILSQQENDSLFEYAVNHAGINFSLTFAPDGGGASYLWIGGNDLQNEGTWIWDGDGDLNGAQFWQGDYQNGNPVGGYFNAWGSINGGEPDDFNNQDGLGLALTSWPFGNPREWNDLNVNNALYFIIEYPSNNAIPPLYPTQPYLLAYDKEGWAIYHDGFIRNLYIYSLEGKQLKSIAVSPDQARILIPFNEFGKNHTLYILRIEATDGRTMFRKLTTQY